MFDAGYRMLGAGMGKDDPEGWYGEGGGRGVQDWEHVWWIHVDVWQNQYNIVKWKIIKWKEKDRVVFCCCCFWCTIRHAGPGLDPCHLHWIAESWPDVLFIIGDWSAKIGSQEIPGVTCKFAFGVQSEAGQRLTELCQENTLIISNTCLQQHTRRLYTWTSPDGQYRLITLFVAEDGEAVYSQQKQDLELTVAQISSLQQNSGLN